MITFPCFPPKLHPEPQFFHFPHQNSPAPGGLRQGARADGLAPEAATPGGAGDEGEGAVKAPRVDGRFTIFPYFS